MTAHYLHTLPRLPPSCSVLCFKCIITCLGSNSERRCGEMHFVMTFFAVPDKMVRLPFVGPLFLRSHQLLAQRKVNARWVSRTRLLLHITFFIALTAAAVPLVGSPQPIQPRFSTRFQSQKRVLDVIIITNRSSRVHTCLTSIISVNISEVRWERGERASTWLVQPEAV